MQKPLLNVTEQKAIDEFKLAASVYNASSDRLETIFRLRIEPLVDKGDYNAARDVIALMPEGVAKMYMADYLRVSRGDFNKGKS